MWLYLRFSVLWHFGLCMRTIILYLSQPVHLLDSSLRTKHICSGLCAIKIFGFHHYISYLRIFLVLRLRYFVLEHQLIGCLSFVYFALCFILYFCLKYVKFCKRPMSIFILQFVVNPIHAVVQLRPSIEQFKSGGSKRKNSVSGNAEVAIKLEDSNEAKSVGLSKKQVVFFCHVCCRYFLFELFHCRDLTEPSIQHLKHAQTRK